MRQQWWAGLMVGVALAAIVLVGATRSWAATTIEAEGTYSMSFRSQPLRDVLRQVFAETNYSYAVPPDIDLTQRLTLTINDVPFEVLLRTVLDQGGLMFRRQGNVFEILRAEKRPTITLTLADTTLAKALDEVFKQTPEKSYTIEPGAKLDELVSVDFRDTDFDDVLQVLLKGTELTATREGEAYRIHAAQTKPAPGTFPEKFSFKWKETRLFDALWELFNQTPYVFQLPPAWENTRVTSTVENVTFPAAVKALLDLDSLTYRREGGLYRIIQAKAANQITEDTEPRVTFVIRGGWIDEVLPHIFRDSDRPYTYTLPPGLDETRRVQVRGKNLSFTKALQMILDQEHLGYIRQGNHFEIIPSPLDPGKTTTSQAEKTVTIELQSVGIKDALDRFFKETGQRYVVERGTALEGRVTVGMTDVPFSIALTAILDQAGLDYIKREGAYRIFERQGTGELTLAREDGSVEPFEVYCVGLWDVLHRLVWSSGYARGTNENVPNLSVTATVNGPTVRSALRSILKPLRLTFVVDERSITIVRSDADTQPPVPRALKPGKLQMFYLTDYGNRAQLRRRILPYPGGETLIWESPDGKSVRSFLPSPSLRQAVVIHRGAPTWHQRVLLVDLSNGEAESILDGKDIVSLYWKDDATLAILAGYERQSHWSYDLQKRTLTQVDAGEKAWDFFVAPFAATIERVRKLAQEGELAIPLRQDAIAGAVQRAATTPPRLIGGAGFPIMPWAAMSPDGKSIALTSGEDVISVLDTMTVEGSEYGFTRAIIPLTTLVSKESVWVESVRWSPDSKYLTFTEVHYHPAQAYGYDIGPRPDPTDWTYLIRMYSMKDNKTDTIAVGRDAFLIPMTVKATEQEPQQ